MLILVEPDFLLNTDAVRTITSLAPVGNGSERAEITFTDGTRKIVNRPVDAFEWCAGPIISAPPGYQVICAFSPEKDGDPMEFATYPVLAFRLAKDEPEPVTPFGKFNDNAWALVWPDGRCDEQWNRLWPSVEDFKTSFGPKGDRS